MRTLRVSLDNISEWVVTDEEYEKAVAHVVSQKYFGGMEIDGEAFVEFLTEINSEEEFNKRFEKELTAYFSPLIIKRIKEILE